jgi:hypothetical protein
LPTYRFLISYLTFNMHRDMDHVNFDNQDHHTSRTLVLLLHSEEFQDRRQSFYFIS